MIINFFSKLALDACLVKYSVSNIKDKIFFCSISLLRIHFSEKEIDYISQYYNIYIT